MVLSLSLHLPESASNYWQINGQIRLAAVLLRAIGVGERDRNVAKRVGHCLREKQSEELWTLLTTFLEKCVPSQFGG